MRRREVLGLLGGAAACSDRLNPPRKADGGGSGRLWTAEDLLVGRGASCDRRPRRRFFMITDAETEKATSGFASLTSTPSAAESPPSSRGRFWFAPILAARPQGLLVFPANRSVGRPSRHA